MRGLFIVLIVCGACLFGNPPGRQVPEASRWLLPVRFEENRGQAAPGVRFLARSEGFELLVRDREIEMRAAPGGRPIRIMLEGAPAGGLHAEDPLKGRTAYFRGAEPSQWITGVANYRKIRYRSVYAGIDLLVYGSQGKLEYDWAVAPGADPAQIRFSVSGVSRTGIDSSGDLVLRGPGFEVRHKKPLVYQEIGGKRREIAGGFRRLGRNRIGFQVGKYDPALPLVIDPYLVYATQFGGNPFLGSSAGADGGGGGRGLAIAVDRAGSAYVGGRVSGPGSLPVTGNPFQSEYGYGYDGFVCKFTPDGSDVVYATYLWGGGFEEVRGIAVDLEGNAYVTGTSEFRFPQAGPFQPRPGAPGSSWPSSTPREARWSGRFLSAGGSSRRGGWAVSIPAIRLETRSRWMRRTTCMWPASPSVPFPRRPEASRPSSPWPRPVSKPPTVRTGLWRRSIPAAPGWPI